MEPALQMPVALTIAGSDSGGGAGIQTDLKTFAALGCFGTSAVTCVTAQNPDEVTGVEAISAEMVARQVDAVCDGYPIAAAKTGMLYSADIIRAVAERVAERSLVKLIVDPVMVSTSGARLLREDAVDALCELLLPAALVTTPNIPEAEILCGHEITELDGLRRAAATIGRRFGIACLLKGGHLEEAGVKERLAGRSVVDILWSNGRTYEFTTPRLDAAETHGTGCTFAAALTAYVARGAALPGAAAQAQAFVASALANPFRAGCHAPLGIGRQDSAT